MRRALALGLCLTGCASLTGVGVTAVEQHHFALPATGGDHGLQVAPGPLTLVQAQYLPEHGEGTALLWTSADASCPPVGPVKSFATLTKFTGWYGSQSVAAGEFLCASHSKNETPATLTWTVGR